MTETEPRTLGKLPPRYKFILNQYRDARLSRCPCCEKLTHTRKFALLIHVDEWGLMVLGLTCRYCTPCKLVMIHQHELETQLVIAFEKHDPGVVGRDYLVIGTVELKTWRAGLKDESNPMETVLEHAADFAQRLDLVVTPGGWRRDSVG